MKPSQWLEGLALTATALAFVLPPPAIAAPPITGVLALGHYVWTGFDSDPTAEKHPQP